jgi:phosphate transport system protein
MSELQKRLETLLLRLDHMGLRVEQAVVDALRAARESNVAAGQQVEENDIIIDREEVEIEQECIRLLALHQPAAIDLRTICMVIKVNSDLERIADKAASIGGRVKHVVAEHIMLEGYPGFETLAQNALDTLRKTVSFLRTADIEGAHRVIEFDKTVNYSYKNLVRHILDRENQRPGGAEIAMTLILLCRALERISDLCTNIAEDVIFLRTGDIIRHPHAFDSSLPSEIKNL